MEQTSGRNWCLFFFSSRRRHTRWTGDWSSDVCSSDLHGWHRSLDFASDDVARDFPRRADSEARCRPADRGFHPGNFFCVADYRPVPRSIGAEVASRLGPGFDRIGSAFLPARAKGFWIFHIVRSAVAENMERRHRSVFPILAAQLRFMGAVVIGACWIVRLAYLEGQVALGRQAASGYRFRGGGSRNFRFRVFRPNRAVGVGQSQTHGMGLLSYSAFPVERHHWALGFPGTSGNMSAALRFRIYHAAWRPVCRTPGLWID